MNFSAEVKPAHFSSSPETKRQIQLIAADFHIAESTVIMSFVGDPYKGTWVHPRLAILAAQYLDRSTFNTGELGYYMAKALHQHSSQVSIFEACAQDNTALSCCLPSKHVDAGTNFTPSPCHEDTGKPVWCSD